MPLPGRRLPLTHGEVRPENCMLLPAGQLKLFDFGTAAAATDLTRRQDTLAVALLLYHVLTGRPPFEGESALGVMLQVISDEPAPPRKLVPSLPLDLDTIALNHREALAEELCKS